MLAAAATLGVLASRADSTADNPNGRLVWGTHISLAPTWFDPAEVGGVITPFMMLYAIHDGLVKPMPNNLEELCLAESYTPSADGLSHEFVLRSGITFHNGARITAEDVKFSYQRYRGNAARFLMAKVAGVETPDPRRVVFRLHAPWPDFLTYYSGVTGAGWIVPQTYVENVGEDDFKKAPIGAGPSSSLLQSWGRIGTRGVRGLLAQDTTVRKLVFRVIPDETTRLAALKRGEVDIAYSIRGELAEEVQRTPGLELKAVVLNGAQWIYFPDQWDLKSPWHDVRVRRAASVALNRDVINQALTLGHSLITDSIVPKSFKFFWQPPKIPYDPPYARALLAEAGFRSGFDAGDYYCDASYSNLAEAALNYLREVGIRAKLRPIERAAFQKGYAEKSTQYYQGGSGARQRRHTGWRLASRAVTMFMAAIPTSTSCSSADGGDRLGEAGRHSIGCSSWSMSAIYAPIWQQLFSGGPRATIRPWIDRRTPIPAPYEAVCQGRRIGPTKGLSAGSRCEPRQTVLHLEFQHGPSCRRPDGL
jgi:peptide/nickel transport system substrate-binding protein